MKYLILLTIAFFSLNTFAANPICDVDASKKYIIYKVVNFQKEIDKMTQDHTKEAVDFDRKTAETIQASIVSSLPKICADEKMKNLSSDEQSMTYLLDKVHKTCSDKIKELKLDEKKSLLYKNMCDSAYDKGAYASTLYYQGYQSRKKDSSPDCGADKKVVNLQKDVMKAIVTLEPSAHPACEEITTLVPSVNNVMTFQNEIPNMKKKYASNNLFDEQIAQSLQKLVKSNLKTICEEEKAKKRPRGQGLTKELIKANHDACIESVKDLKQKFKLDYSREMVYTKACEDSSRDAIEATYFYFDGYYGKKREEPASQCENEKVISTIRFKPIEVMGAGQKNTNTKTQDR